MAVSPSTLHELRRKLRQLLAQEDRLLAEYEHAHEKLHFSQRTPRTAAWEECLMKMREKLFAAQMKDLSTEARDVGARRRELLKEIVEIEKAEATAVRATMVPKEDGNSEEAEAAVAP